MQARHMIAAAALAATGAFVVTRAVYSGDDPNLSASGKLSDEEMWKMIQERAKPTEEHSKLSNLAGTWDANVVCNQGGVEKHSKGSMTSESVLGGRALLSRFKGEMDGHPFEGVELTGYDKEKKQHWTIWTDSFGTGALRMLGDQGAGDVINQKSEEFQCNGVKCTANTTTKVVDPDHVNFEMVTSSPGQPDQKMTINYVRRK